MLACTLGCAEKRVPPDFGAACDDGVPRFADGGCPIVCEADRYRCDGDIADVCDATGTHHALTDCAAQGARCVIRPLTAECEKQSCTPSTTFCSPDGKQVLKCSPDGHSSEVVQDCDDPNQRGRRCVGVTCLDRCQLLEAKDRSTLGCRFLTAAGTTPQDLIVTNAQTDLPATVNITYAGAAHTLTLAPSTTQTLALSAPIATGTSVGTHAISVWSSVPVAAWLTTMYSPVTCFPEHAASQSYLVGMITASSHRIEVIALANGTQVDLRVTGATQAGGGVPAASAGGTLSRTLDRGQVLTVAGDSSATLEATRITSTAPVVVFAQSQNQNSAPRVALPGADTLGRDLVTHFGGHVVARNACTVTTELNGTLTLAAGESRAVDGHQRIQSSEPILLLSSTGFAVPPVEQWRSSYVTRQPGPGAIGLYQLYATAPLVVQANPGGAISLTPPTTSTLSAEGGFSGVTASFSAAAPFLAVHYSDCAGGHGLDAINP